MVYETLNTEGFLFTEVTGAWSILRADFGEGYEAAATVGMAEGTHSWMIKIDALPDSKDQAQPVNGLSRAQYLWQFFQATKAAANRPFWLEFEDPKDGIRKQYLACFSDDQLSYAVLCAKVYATGLPIRERRVSGVISPLKIPEFDSGEVGNVNSKTVVVQFSTEVAAANFATGVTIRINGAPVTINSANSPASPLAAYYLLNSSVPVGAKVTWEYVPGNITGYAGGPMAKSGVQPIKNNVRASVSLLSEGGDALITENDDPLLTET